MAVRRVFIDTNVLVYAHYRGQSLERRTTARAALGSLQLGSVVCISPQVITEILNVARTKMGGEVTRGEAVEVASMILDEYELIALDQATTREALRGVERYGLGYLDAQIWSAARVGGCTAILTEDTHGEEIEGVRYVNPFAEGFDLEAVLRA